MQCGLEGAYDCIKAFSETDLTASAWPPCWRARATLPARAQVDPGQHRPRPGAQARITRRL